MNCAQVFVFPFLGGLILTTQAGAGVLRPELDQQGLQQSSALPHPWTTLTPSSITTLQVFPLYLWLPLQSFESFPLLLDFCILEHERLLFRVISHFTFFLGHPTLHMTPKRIPPGQTSLLSSRPGYPMVFEMSPPTLSINGAPAVCQTPLYIWVGNQQDG